MACSLAYDVAAQDRARQTPTDIVTQVFIVTLLQAIHARVSNQKRVFAEAALLEKVRFAFVFRLDLKNGANRA